MLQLKPDLETAEFDCPHCDRPMIARDFLIPGMRNLADLFCGTCGREFYGDLRAGQALFTPQLIGKADGVVYDDFGVAWFADWLENSFRQKTDKSLSFEIKRFTELKSKTVLLNCIDTLYGHSLLKLLNAQYYLDHRPDISLIVLVQKTFEWMLPDGIAEAWIVDLPFGRGTEWNDWLASEIDHRLNEIEEVYLSIAFSHPNHCDFDIERFTRVAPLELSALEARKIDPVVTFIWREDRVWGRQIEVQIDAVIELAAALRGKFPSLDFAAAGFGKTGVFPGWITDLRTTNFDAQTERRLCERYGRSHIVVGVHGSNMLLPSAHAGCVIELMPFGRWGNYLQDVIFRSSDERDIFFRYRFLPDSTTPAEVASIAHTMLRHRDFQKLMGPDFTRHSDKHDLDGWLSEKTQSEEN